MKKIFAILLTLFLISCVACNKSFDSDYSDDTNQDSTAASTTEQESTTEGDSEATTVSNVESDTESDIASDTETEKAPGNTTEPESESEIESEPVSQNPEETTEIIDMSKVTESYIFSEGKAWVQFGDITSAERKVLYCINTSGEILFKVENTSLSSPTPFHNGIAFVPVQIENGSYEYCICDENGNITKPSDVGATEFFIRPDSESKNSVLAFEDGYIFAIKITASFDSSSYQMAILNSNLEIVSDYSEKNYEFIDKYLYQYYYNGYCYYNDYGDINILDLSTGKEIDDINAFIKSFEPEYASDMWDYNDLAYYNKIASEYTETLNLSKYSETIYQMYPFSDGLAPIMFKSAEKYFFAILKEDGSFCFEPVEIPYYVSVVHGTDGKFVVISRTESNTYELKVFDTNGNISTIPLEKYGLYLLVHISDNIVHVQSSNYNLYYSLDGTLLF